MIGLCALREAAGVTDLFAPAKRAQVHTMEALCERALQSGAAGVSLGPGYAPGTSLEEMEALCTMARRYGRPAAIDTRMFAMTDLNSLSEAIELAEVTGCRMIVSHFEYQYGVGVEYKALEMLDSIDFPPELIVNSTFERFEAYIAEREARMKTASVL